MAKYRVTVTIPIAVSVVVDGATEGEPTPWGKAKLDGRSAVFAWLHALRNGTNALTQNTLEFDTLYANVEVEEADSDS